jgi:hypothetical protein
MRRTLGRKKAFANLEGKLCQTPDGQRVRVMEVGTAQSGLPVMAMVTFVDELNKGYGRYFAKDLKLLSPEISPPDKTS